MNMKVWWIVSKNDSTWSDEVEDGMDRDMDDRVVDVGMRRAAVAHKSPLRPPRMETRLGNSLPEVGMRDWRRAKTLE